MKTSFLGAVCSQGDCDRAAFDARLRETVFAGGYFAHAEGVSVHERDGVVCLALGRPRFLDQARAETAATQGAAAAWLDAFGALGSKAPARVADRFAVALVRPERRSVLLATDRFATWPLFYAVDGGTFSFASTARDLHASRPLSLQALFSYLLFHVVPSPETIFEGVTSVLPATVLEWQDGQVGSTQYWRPSFHERSAMSLTEAEERFRTLIREAVAREADGESVGAFLSGGTDSSTVSGMLSRISSVPPKTYSIGFDVAGYDEMEYARIASRHFKTQHREYYVTPGDLEQGIEKIVAYGDQPFGNSSVVPALICAERAKNDGTGKLLAGDGGDELFGGNTRYAKQRVFGWYGNIPEPLRRRLLEPMLGVAFAKRMPLVRKASSYVEQARVPLPDRSNAYNLLVRLGLEQVLEPRYLAAVDTERPFARQREWWSSIDAVSELNRMLAFDWKITLVDSDLPKVIAATGCAGVDVAFPFLADELVDFSAQLDPEWKLKGLTLRWFFKRALRDFLPVEILRKKKHGFGLPFGAWACSHEGLARLAAETLGSFEGRGVVRPAFVRTLLSDLLPAHPGYYGELVFVLLTLELWLKGHAPDFRC